MAYTPPPIDQVGFQLEGGYTPPAIDQCGFILADTLEVVESGIVLELLHVWPVEAGCGLHSAIAMDRIDGGCEIVTVQVEAGVETSCEIYRPHAIESTTLIVRGAAQPITASITIVRRNGVPVERGCEVVRQGMIEVDSACEMIMAMAIDLVEAGCVIECAHSALTPVEAGCLLITLDGSLPPEQIETAAPVISLLGTVAGVPSPLVQPGALESMISLQLTASRDQYAVTGSMELGEAAEFLACEHGADIEFSLAGRTVRLRVTDRRRSRSHGDWRYTIDLQSPAAWLDAPYAATVTEETLSGLASTLATQLAAGVTTIAWQTTDWTIPADGLPAAGQTPLSLLRTLAATAGAVLVSDWDGSMRVEPEYPLSVTAWPTATPAILISEAAEVITAEDDDDWRGGHNAYRLATSDPEAATGDLRIDTVDNDDGSKTVRAASVPWDDTLTLSHRGGTWVQLALAGDVWREETETAQMVGGQGRTQYPCRQVLATDWLEHELGAITANEDGLITSATVGDSLLSITYRTLARAWTLIDSRDEDVMVVAETDDQAAGAGVSVLVTRGAGDLRGEDVVDPLLTDVAVARERGRNLIDATCSRRQLVTLSCPFTALHDHGALVEVREAADGPWRGMLRGQSVTLAAADDGTLTWDTTLTIEREAA